MMRSTSREVIACVFAFYYLVDLSMKSGLCIAWLGHYCRTGLISISICMIYYARHDLERPTTLIIAFQCVNLKKKSIAISGLGLSTTQSITMQ